MKYRYFVSYKFKKNGRQGTGTCDLTLNKKIKHYQHLEEITKFIEEEWNLEEALITNYKLLRKSLFLKD